MRRSQTLNRSIPLNVSLLFSANCSVISPVASPSCGSMWSTAQECRGPRKQSVGKAQLCDFHHEGIRYTFATALRPIANARWDKSRPFEALSKLLQVSFEAPSRILQPSTTCSRWPQYLGSKTASAPGCLQRLEAGFLGFCSVRSVLCRPLRQIDYVDTPARSQGQRPICLQQYPFRKPVATSYHDWRTSLPSMVLLG